MAQGKVLVVEGTGNCHHEGRYTNWNGEEVCSLCDTVLSIDTRQSTAENLRHGTHIRQGISIRQIF